MPLIDLSHEIFDGMSVFPGEKSPTLIADTLPEDAAYVTFRLESNMHTGTHLDAPYHAKADEKTVGSYPLSHFTGPARVIDVRGRTRIHMRPEWNELFREYKFILFCTGHSATWGTPEYYAAYPVFDDEVAEALKANKVRIVGFDSPSPDVAPYRFHSIFLQGERFLVENLRNLEELIEIRKFDFCAFPLKLQAEASLVRAVAKY